jgi:hypothetical protein
VDTAAVAEVAGAFSFQLSAPVKAALKIHPASVLVLVGGDNQADLRTRGITSFAPR